MQALPAPATAAVNHLLGQAAWAQSRLMPFAGHIAQIKLPPFEAAFVILADGFIGTPHTTDAGVEIGVEISSAEVSITLPATTPLLALQGMDTVMRAARLEGSAEFAEALGFVIRNLRWDIEEDLSNLVGDIAAHRIVGSAKTFAAWQGQTAQNLAENLAEYFTEEQPMITHRTAIVDFSNTIDQLRDDAARLEKRIQQLG
jgi:ubiquinone biosynthesis protein UbiJ